MPDKEITSLPALTRQSGDEKVTLRGSALIRSVDPSDGTSAELLAGTETGARNWTPAQLAAWRRTQDVLDGNASFDTIADANSSVPDDVSLIDTFVKTLGRNSKGDGGGATWKIVPYSSPDGYGTYGAGRTNTMLQLVADKWFVTPEMFGAIANEPTFDSRPHIQAAWDFTISNNVAYLQGPGRTYYIGLSGSTTTDLTNAPYGLIVKSGMTLHGLNSDTSAIQAMPSTNMAVIASEIPFSNVTMSGLKINGDSSNNPDGYDNLVFREGTNLNIYDIKSVDAAGYGQRYSYMTDCKFNDLYSYNTYESIGTDAIHFYDLVRCYGNGFYAHSEGDDAFIVTAGVRDVEDVIFTGVIATSVAHSGSRGNGGRGILINLSDAASAADNVYTFRRVKIEGATNNCNGQGTFVSWANFEQLTVNVADTGSYRGLLIDGKGSSQTTYGSFKNCEFNIKSVDAYTNGLFMLNCGPSEAVCSNNSMSAQIINPGDGSVGALMDGDDWFVDIQIDYDPDGTKSSPLQGLDCFLKNSTVKAAIRGASSNVYVRSESDNMEFIGLNARDAVNNGINVVSGASNIRFTGGTTNGDAISGTLTGVSFNGMVGTDSGGFINATPDASGYITIAHGLLGTPTQYTGITLSGSDSDRLVQVNSVDGTNIVYRIRDGSNTSITNTVGLSWSAKL